MRLTTRTLVGLGVFLLLIGPSLSAVGETKPILLSLA